MQNYSIFSLVKNAFSNHQDWEVAWKDPEPKKEYDVIIIGGGIRISKTNKKLYKYKILIIIMILLLCVDKIKMDIFN